MLNCPVYPQAWLPTDNASSQALSFLCASCAGDMPIVLTCDGPSLGGFVCPATIPSTDLWKMGQVSPNDKVTFKQLTLGE